MNSARNEDAARIKIPLVGMLTVPGTQSKCSHTVFETKIAGGPLRCTQCGALWDVVMKPDLAPGGHTVTVSPTTTRATRWKEMEDEVRPLDEHKMPQLIVKAYGTVTPPPEPTKADFDRYEPRLHPAKAAARERARLARLLDKDWAVAAQVIREKGAV